MSTLQGDDQESALPSQGQGSPVRILLAVLDSEIYPGIECRRS